MTIFRWLLDGFLDICHFLRPNSEGLVRAGDWYVRYPDGRRTRGLSLLSAYNVRRTAGGTMHWINRKAGEK